MSYMSPPPTPPHTTPLNSAPPTPSAASTSFRLPAQPTILLKAPSEETIARLRQLAPYYWSHPQTTNCAIHFPIDPKQQARIQAYQARQRQAAVTAHQSRSRQGSVAAEHHHSGHARRPSVTPPTPSTCSPTPTSSPPQSVSRQSSAHRLRAVHSGSGLAISAARQSILGLNGTPEPEPSKRRGSITPGYDPFSRAGTSFVSQPSSPTPFGLASPSGRRESVPLTPTAQQATLSVPTTPDILRRGSAPVSGANGGNAKNLTPMRTVRLHVEYLTAQSALIRQVLAEAAGYIPPVNPSSDSFATPPDSPPSSASSASSSPTNPFPHSFFRFSPHRYPRVIYPKSTPSSTPTPGQQSSSSSQQGGPIIVLPVPDPQSFPLLIHYMYHGKMDAIERTLREGQVSWEGLVRNVEYLGLRDDVKRYLGKWWKNWRDSEARRARGGAAAEDDEEDEDEDDGRKAYPYPTAKDLKMDLDGDDSSGVGDWTDRASANAAGGELVDEMAGLLDRF